MTRHTIDIEDGFITLKGPCGRDGRWVLTAVADNAHDYETGYTLVAPARALELWATRAQMRQIAEAIIASLDGEVAS